MKKLPFYIGIFVAASAFFASCDVVDNPVPLKPAYQPLSDSLALDSAETARGITTPEQKVLLEDYTGHQCGNCPDAAVEAKALKARHGDKLVVMAVHAGYFAKTVPGAPGAKYTYNFSTPAGEEWATSFGILANPNGMVNRTPANGSTSVYQGIASWSGSVVTQLAKTPQAGLTVTPLFDHATRTLNIKVRTEYLNNLTGKYNLAVFITEDSIVNWQKNYKTNPVDVEKYVHPHALRATVDGTWGHLNKENPTTGTISKNYFAYTLPGEWKEKKCSVVAILFDATSKEIIQVEEQHVHAE